jgi:hypothetical protein
LLLALVSQFQAKLNLAAAAVEEGGIQESRAEVKQVGVSAAGGVGGVLEHVEGAQAEVRVVEDGALTQLGNQRKDSLRCAGGPAIRFANWGEGETVKRRGTEAAKSIQMDGSAVALVLGETVAGIFGV